MLFVYFLLLLMIFMWGFSFIVVDNAVNYISPLSVALYRFILASLSFLVIDFIIKIRKRVRKIESTPRNQVHTFSKKDWSLVILASFSGASFYLFFLYSAIELIGPSLTSMFDSLLTPVIIAILSIAFLKEKLSHLKIIGFVIATIGAFFLVTGGDPQTLAPASPNFLGLMMGLMTPLLWSIYSVTSRGIAKSNKDSEYRVLKYMAYFACIELFFFVIIAGEFQTFIINFFNITLFLSAVYLGVFCFTGGYYIWNFSQKKIESSRAASFLYLQPFLTLMFSLFFRVNENIMLWNILGGIVVLMAVCIINYNKKKAWNFNTTLKPLKNSKIG